MRQRVSVQRRFLEQVVTHADHDLVYDAGTRRLKNLSTGKQTRTTKELRDFMAGAAGAEVTVIVNPKTLRLERI